jgi:hypothetical protein
MTRQRLLRAAAIVGLAFCLALPLPARAAWSAATAAGGEGRSAATTMPAGNQPTAAVSGAAEVTVSWAAASGGAPVTGYEVRAYDAGSGTPRAVGAACAGVVAGTSCIESAAPDGAWRYAIVPRSLSWSGAESPLSDPVLVDSTPPSVTSLVLTDGDGVVTPGTDEVHITFSEAVDTASVCSTWSGSGDQSLGGAGVVVTITDSGTNDVLTVAAGACTLHVGSVATGGDYVLLTSTFSGSTAATESRVSWTAASRRLTVHIGAQTAGLANVLPQAAATVTYTPDAAITDEAGNGVVTTPFSAAAQRF